MLFDFKDVVLWVLVDDSGICVDVFGGGLGVELVYFVGLEGDFVVNLWKLIEVMCEVLERGGD